MPWRTVLVLLPVVLAVSGCGDTRIQSPPVTAVAPPAAFRALSYPHSGVRITVPGNWGVATTRAPLLAVVSSGTATIALWRYPASAVPPAGTVELAAARRSLVDAVRARDPQLALLGASLVSVDGDGGVLLNTLQRFSGGLRRVVSEHVYVPGSELVLEEYAPPAVFRAVDRTVFARVLHSLRLLPAGAT